MSLAFGVAAEKRPDLSVREFLADRLYPTGRARTKQEQKDECDINNILRRYKATGMMSHLARGVPTFADVSEAGTLREILDRVSAASEWFSHLPAHVRSEFRNDPAVFVDAMNNPDMKPKMMELGLIPKEEAPPPIGGGASVSS